MIKNFELIEKLKTLPADAIIKVAMEDYEHDMEMCNDDKLKIIEWEEDANTVHLSGGQRKNGIQNRKVL